MTESTTTSSPPTVFARLREAITSALRYWEPRRIIYNVVLAIVVLFYVVSSWPMSRDVITFDHVLILFVMAVLANVAYCVAYLGDVFVQLSGFRDGWLRWRWVLFAVGTAFAAVITRFFSIGFFGRA